MTANMKQNFETFKKNIDEALHEQNKFTEVLEKIETKTGVARVNIVLGVAGFLALYLAVGYGADFLCNFIGFSYPAYKSMKAIESHEKDDDTKWLTYWVVYSTFSLLEFFADIFFFWVPFYWLMKCIFLLWCFAPIENNGSVVIYNRAIRPFVLKHEKKVDKVIEDIAGEAKLAAKDAFGKAENFMQEKTSEAVKRHIADSSEELLKEY